jgi:hypothetical protein
LSQTFGDPLRTPTCRSTQDAIIGGIYGLRNARRDHIKPKVAWDIAVARRSAIVTSFETDVGAGALPKRWPSVTMGERKSTFRLCSFPIINTITSLSYVRVQLLCELANKDSTKKMSEAEAIGRTKMEDAQIHDHVTLWRTRRIHMIILGPR